MTGWQQKILGRNDPELRRRLHQKLEAALEPSLHKPGLIDRYYLPVFFYLYELVIQQGRTGFIAGINAPQGGGKSTLTSYLVRLFDWAGLRAVTLSIDDFYLTRAEQVRLATNNAGNPYLQQRGYPGTHDIALGVDILSQLKQPDFDIRLALPRYDKSKHGGQGDRADNSVWPGVDLPVDIVLFEGWMLGFRPAPAEDIKDTALLQINTLLQSYAAWHQLLDGFIYLYPEYPEYVVDWRSEAEAHMKSKGLPGMSADEVRAYAKKFLPAYQLYGPRLIDGPPAPEFFLPIRIGRDRLPA